MLGARTDTDVADIVKIILSHHITRMPVLDDQRLVGLVSRSDLVRPLTRPDADIEADLRQRLDAVGTGHNLDAATVTDGEATLVVPGHRELAVLVRLVRAVPGVIAVRLVSPTDGPPR